MGLREKGIQSFITDLIIHVGIVSLEKKWHQFEISSLPRLFLPSFLPHLLSVIGNLSDVCITPIPYSLSFHLSAHSSFVIRVMMVPLSLSLPSPSSSSHMSLLDISPYLGLFNSSFAYPTDTPLTWSETGLKLFIFLLHSFHLRSGYVVRFAFHCIIHYSLFSTTHTLRWTDFQPRWRQQLSEWRSAWWRYVDDGSGSAK